MKLMIFLTGMLLAAHAPITLADGAPSKTGDEAEVQAIADHIDSLWFSGRTYAQISMHIVTAHYMRDLKLNCWGEGK